MAQIVEEAEPRFANNIALITNYSTAVKLMLSQKVACLCHFHPYPYPGPVGFEGILATTSVYARVLLLSHCDLESVPLSELPSSLHVIYSSLPRESLPVFGQQHALFLRRTFARVLNSRYRIRE